LLAFVVDLAASELLLPVSLEEVRLFGPRPSSCCFRELLPSVLLPFDLGSRMVSLPRTIELVRDFGRSTTTPQAHTGAFSLGILEEYGSASSIRSRWIREKAG